MTTAQEFAIEQTGVRSAYVAFRRDAGNDALITTAQAGEHPVCVELRPDGSWRRVGDVGSSYVSPGLLFQVPATDDAEQNLAEAFAAMDDKFDDSMTYREMAFAGYLAAQPA